MTSSPLVRQATLIRQISPGRRLPTRLPTCLRYGSLHTNKIVFSDDINYYTNTWSWTSVALTRFATNGSLSVRGFDARLVESFTASTDPTVYTNYANMDCTNLTPPFAWEAIPNGVSSAQAVLNYQYAVNFSATNLVQVVNFDIVTGSDPNINSGNPTTNFPGLCFPAGSAYVNSFAVEVLAYLQLPAGTNSFWVDSDDASAVFTGTNLTDTSTSLMSNNGVTHQSFTWYVPQAGLYPVHIVMQQGWGGGYLGLNTLNLTAGTTNLVNSASSSVQAFYPLVVESSTSIKGPYTVDAAANAGNALTTASSLCESGTGTITNLTVTGGTLTLPASGPPKFYRLDGPRATRFTHATKSGSNVVITYQAN